MTAPIPRVIFGALLCFVVSQAQATIYSCVYKINVGYWSNVGNWTCYGVADQVPDNSPPTRFFATISPSYGANNISLDQSVTLDKLAIDGGATLHILNNQILTLDYSQDPTDQASGSGVSNVSGLLSIGSTGSLTGLRLAGPQTIAANDGFGEITLSDNSLNIIEGVNGGGQDNLTLSAINVTGSGQIGRNTLSLVTDGVVTADGTAGLTIDPDDAGSYPNRAPCAQSTARR